jgi:signal transduction histidine kinase
VKFTEKGEIRLSVDYRVDGVEITIADTGAGVPEGQTERIFEAFWQAADHTTRAVGGNGLGLYICKSLADLLGGKVWLHASAKTGSIFKLRLPSTCVLKPSARLMKSDVWIQTAKGLESATRK